MKRTAVLVDGGFFFERVRFFARKYFRPGFLLNSEQLSTIVHVLVKSHIEERRTLPRELYRVYYYDCPPNDKQVRYPITPEGHRTPGNINFKEHPPYKVRGELHDRLKKSRKTALRLGELSKSGRWRLNDHSLDDLLKGQKNWADLTNADFHYDIDQKAVDIKLGMDITTLALNKLADVIVLIAGDSDFVPAAKLARTNGIDFVLDPMWATTAASLSEHVDGVRSYDIVRMISNVTREPVANVPVWWRQPDPADAAEPAPEYVNPPDDTDEPGVPD
ncbi:nuclease [Pseudomonas brassicacearum]|uniref:Nuclease n=1 Tax=Pseudomonas brassicacearum TaxID=930166 RepID=A0A423HCA1_9PSED|nr:NYN domain-containing protein [Pseudomonas brassicacearum]RON10865.1 nuclease [Pseudomonas brassicacearum]